MLGARSSHVFASLAGRPCAKRGSRRALGRVGAMTSLRRIGFDDVNERALFLMEAADAAALPSHFVVGSDYFVALVVTDATKIDTSAISRVARILLKAGCVYFCCWGPDCERVHDIIDGAYASDGTDIGDRASTIMTTWHNDESLEEATWFALNVAFPDDQFFDKTEAVVAVAIGSADWSREIEAALSDPRALVRRVVNHGDQRPNHALRADAPGRRAGHLKR